jgi:hypothetical protein
VFMKKRYECILIPLLVTLYCVIGTTVQAQEFKQFINGNGYTQIDTENGISLQWKVDGKNLRIILNAETTGWLAVGFDPSVKMKDANFIIGFIKNGTLYVRDEYGTGPEAHLPDTKIGGREDVSEVSGYEKDGRTEIHFTIPLHSGDAKDKKLIPGQRYLILLAFGTADSFSKVHSIEAESKGYITL